LEIIKLKKDCSIQDCPNNCSADINPEIGKCIQQKPVSQCDCNQILRRGGDDCSVIFCLNDCKPNGNCNYKTGQCICNEEFYGIDCSLLIPNFRISSEKYKMNILVLILALIIMI